MREPKAVSAEVDQESLAQWIRRNGPFAAGDPVPRRVVPLMAADYNALRDELNEPRLGLATTRQLLEEVAVRLEIGGTSQIERSSAATLRGMLDVLPVDCLAYRTVDNA